MEWERICPKTWKYSTDMKTIKIALFALGVCILLFGCDANERAQLQRTVDSLNVELVASQKVNETMDEVGVLIDSIDASRHLLRSSIVEGTTYADFTSRLKEINTYIKETESKIDNLEATVKKSRGMASTIKRLRADLEERSNQVAALQVEVDKAHGENDVMRVSLARRDSVITTNEAVIKVKEESIANLEGLVKDISEQSQMTKANLYYEQAKALELAAQRTAFQNIEKEGDGNKEKIKEGKELTEEKRTIKILK
jgi:hypothetical protein